MARSTSVVNLTKNVPRSGDEVSQTPESKKMKMTAALEQQFKDLDLANRSLILEQLIARRKIHMNGHVLNTILNIDNDSEVDVFTAQEYVFVQDFTEVDQFKVLLGENVRLLNDTRRATTAVIPLAHLFFKLARSHICLRVGNKSNFTR
ncbi:hypothetical protein POM88_048973 [Heracleum sosnowskyi]|uniref:Uncharacterized protein n=1 Tax=Heracleum sosnowskyi TaxID=360622 RepID=A0AAD8GUS0_9APIA|nr:hypothetical protein POM88_048973 [Heracleum sosnowskyi]